jgi:phenol hydroxylase P4 protein
MTVAAVSEYKFSSTDSLDKFHGAQLLYVGWKKHLMFYGTAVFALPPSLKFEDLFSGPLAHAYSPHPDFEKIDWSKVNWFKDGNPWKPDYQKTLAENLIGHKDCLHFETPGLEGLYGVNF